MSDNTGIEWTDSTWNPVTGCTKVSAGCDHCYAETLFERFNGKGSFTTVQLKPERLDQPLHWRRPRRIFVNSMSDLFHDDVPDDYIARVFAVMALAPRHTFQVLTKRHGRMRSLLSSPDFRFSVEHAATLCKHREWAASDYPRGKKAEDRTRWQYPGWPLPNVWLGVSVETQQWADIRIPALLDTPAAVRFLSMEPLLGPVTFRWAKWAPVRDASHLDGLKGIGWVIVGGESGRGARPMQPEWARSLRDQCNEVGVPFLFKQWGEWSPTKALAAGVLTDPRECFGEVVEDGKYPQIQWRRVLRRVGKKAAGRELDGRTWDEYPTGGAS